MERSTLLLILGAVAVVVAIQFGGSSSGLRAGDTVTPILVSQGPWAPGSEVELRVRLEAKDTEGKARPLGFNGINQNPVASLAFFAGESQLSSAQVTLSHRC